ncbi:MAG: MarR family winged helix-turn-helix transcriptional regulator [Galactobacter sp.]|uniref:MarR family winged helix-turn-helix transcriptional regulator n=1 Tax=Galactobacter sp. TaxID=2676125 RepID=UPI0025C54F2D|nr:MarR family winged helix-turn-helix transcriptional regulator [Galactobacter sp.]
MAGFDIDTMTGHQLRLAQQRHVQLWTQIVGQALSSTQYVLLEACATLTSRGLEPDQVSAGRLAGIDRSTTTEMVSRLGDQGWLISAKSSTDRRRQVLSLTPPAAAAITWCSPLVDRVQVELMRPLTDAEQEWLLPRWSLLAGLNAGTDVDTAEAAGGDDAADAGHATSDTGYSARRPGHLLRRAQQRHLQLWTEEVSTQWTSQQFALLNAAGAAGPNGASQVQLGQVAGIDRSSTSHLVTKLVSQSLLERRPDPDDARRRLVLLTESGQATHAELAKGAAALQQTLLAPLDRADRQRTRDLLRRIAEGA